MPDAEERFEVPVSELGGRGDGVVINDEGLAWTGPDGRRRRGLDELLSVEIQNEPAAEDPFVLCVLTFAAGAPLTVRVDCDQAEKIAAFRGLILTLIDRLGPERRQRVRFLTGPRPAARTLQIVLFAIGFVGTAGVFLFELVSPETYTQPNEWLLLPLILFFVIALGFGLGVAIKSGQKPFDPLAIPPGVLPDVPVRRAGRGRPDGGR